MPLYNVLEYSQNYSKTTGSLYQYKRDKEGAIAADIDNRSAGTTAADGTLNVEIHVPLKYLSNF